MKEFLFVYLITMLLSNGFGISVINSALPKIKEKIAKKGYNVEKKNFIPALNDVCIKALLAFIPFYYLFKAISLIQGDVALEKAAQEEIESGKYTKIVDIEAEEIISDTSIEEDVVLDNSRINEDFVVENLNSRYSYWEEAAPEKYVARKNDISIFNNDETPIDFISRVSTNDDVLNISKYVALEKEDLSKDTIFKDALPEEKIVKDEIKKEDIVRLITKIDPKVLDTIIKDSTSLDSLREQLEYESKRNNVLTLEKEVA